MSRIGRQKITIPDQVEVKQDGTTLLVKGPLGVISRVFKDDILIEAVGQEIKLSPRPPVSGKAALWGSYASHLRNLIQGVTKGFQKRLILEGLGYRASLSGDVLNLQLGFSHPLAVPIPKGLKVTVDKNFIIVAGIDKEKVGQFAAMVRNFKNPEPYKGKGIHYETEVVRRKEGKKVVTA